MSTPVLIVSGFLGSGKTTLVRRLLEQSQRAGVRTAVISNELGALGIDEALLGSTGVTGAEFVELAGGCVCCQLSAELVQTLIRLHQTVNPDRIVIETSGVALPFETQLHLYRPGVREWLGDEACIVVVDATGSAIDAFVDPSGESTPNQTFEQQVQSADLLVLSKGDLTDTAPMRARLHDLAAETPLVEAVKGDLPDGLLFPRGPGPRETAPRPHTHEAFATEELRFPADIPLRDLEAQLADLHALRMKGFVQTAEGVRIVQGVGRRIELSDVGDLAVPDALIGRVVVIRRAPGTIGHDPAHTP